jgi:hypothetical protein
MMRWRIWTMTDPGCISHALLPLGRSPIDRQDWERSQVVAEFDATDFAAATLVYEAHLRGERLRLCEHCGKEPVCHAEARFCGAGCTARHEAGETPVAEGLLERSVELIQ